VFTFFHTALGFCNYSIHLSDGFEPPKYAPETGMGPFIKYIMLFLANFDPSLTLSHILGPPKYVTHLGRTLGGPSTKNPDKTPCTNSLSIVRGVSVQGVLSGGL